MNDLISRQAAIDIERNATVDTNPSHFEAHQKFTQFMDDAEVSSFGRWQWANGFNTALTAVGIDLKKLPSAQPEERTKKRTETRACDLISRSAVYDRVSRIVSVNHLDPEKVWFTPIGVKALIEEMPPAQPEEAIPVSWIEARIERFKTMGNAFGGLTANIMLVMLNEWKREQEGDTK